VRLVIARHGADPAILKPTPIPVLQAAQLLGVPPSACAVVASTPADIRSARLAGARAIGYARDPATRQRLTDAGAEAATDYIVALAGNAYLAAAVTAARRRVASGRQAVRQAHRAATPDTGTAPQLLQATPRSSHSAPGRKPPRPNRKPSRRQCVCQAQRGV
jgi:beta-phosphoglucomutase-like phosphatase (HAD superfamily)